jgi:hypothetical protein
VQNTQGFAGGVFQPVRVIQGITQAAGHECGRHGPHGFATLREPARDGTEVASGHPLERHVQRLTNLAELIDRADVAVREPGANLGFAHERLDEVRISRHLRQHALDRDQTLKACFTANFGAVHGGGGTRADLVQQDVFAERDQLIH